MFDVLPTLFDVCELNDRHCLTFALSPRHRSFSPFGGTIYPVNSRRRANIFGIRAYQKVYEIPERGIDLAIIAVPAGAVKEVSVVFDCDCTCFCKYILRDAESIRRLHTHISNTQ